MLAVLAAAAGIIHLAMVPSHWGESAVEGFGFALAGWVQLTLAVALLVRPSRALAARRDGRDVRLRRGVGRQPGLGTSVRSSSSGHPHDPSFIDLACVGIEVAFIAVAGVVLCRPRAGTRSGAAMQYGLRGAALASMAVLALATAALASPSARDHTAGEPRSARPLRRDGRGRSRDPPHTCRAADVKSGWTALGENGHQHGTGIVDARRCEPRPR